MSFMVFALIAVVYLFWTDLSLIKKLIGYNVPELAEPKIVTSDGGELSFLNILKGFEISIAANGLENPRVIAFDPKGRTLVSETKAGRVSVLTDNDPEKSQSDLGASKDGVFESKNILIENLKSPHGLDFFKDPKTGTTYLYIAETHQVAKYPYDINAGKLLETAGENITNLPAEGRHFTRTIAFGPNFRVSQIVSGIGGIDTQADTKLYISVGSSCDVCEENTWKRATILESDPEGSYTAEFAGGLRNSVFFAFHPVTKEIWATEMGRDNLGDDLPPDEVNIVKVAGLEQKFGARRYGWPFCYGNKIKDATFKPEKWERIDITDDCSISEPPVIQIPAHSAPLGLAFVPSRQGWPKEWEGDLLVAYHGSWNRSIPTGYKVVRYDLDKNGKVLSQEPVDFISGWLKTSNQIYGRPVDLKFSPDGTLYISDDAAGAIYRVKPIN